MSTNNGISVPFLARHQYRSSLFRFSKEFLSEVTTLHEEITLRALLWNWLSIFLIIYSARFLYRTDAFWPCYVPLTFLIASRIGFLVNILHEASHGFLAKDRVKNNRIAVWFGAYPIGVNYFGYAAHHSVHHAFAATSKDVDTDLEKYRAVNFRQPTVYLHLFKDLLGITAVYTAVKYLLNDKDVVLPNVKHRGLSRRLRNVANMAAVQFFLIGVLFQFDLVAYFLLWIVPCISPHMFLMRIRGIAEHGLSGQLDKIITEPSESTYYTRSFYTELNRYAFRPFVWFERFLIGSLHINYHHEHHLLPMVPHYHLKKVHEEVCRQVQRANPHVYETGYFAAALKNLWFDSFALYKN